MICDVCQKELICPHYVNVISGKCSSNPPATDEDQPSILRMEVCEGCASRSYNSFVEVIKTFSKRLSP